MTDASLSTRPATFEAPLALRAGALVLVLMAVVATRPCHAQQQQQGQERQALRPAATAFDSTGAALASALQAQAPDRVAPFEGVAGAASFVEAALRDTSAAADAPSVTRAYRAVVAGLGPGLSGKGRAATRPLAARLALLLPEKVKRDVLASGAFGEVPSGWRFAEGAGERLSAWWRAQDPLPATPENERLAEHLERVAFALKHFPDENASGGLDDRGKTYVQYGSPGRVTEVPIREGDDAEMPARRYRLPELHDYWVKSQGPRAPELRPFALWTYPSVADEAYFLFADEGGRYVHSDMQGIHRNPMDAMSSIPTILYERLGFVHSEFERRRFAAATAPGSEDQEYGYTFGGIRRSLPGPSLAPFAGSFRGAATQDWRAENRRAEALPAQRSSLLDDVAELDVDWRAARFLDPEAGTTTAEVYWAPEPGALTLAPETQQLLAQAGYEAPRRYALEGTLRAYGRAYRSEAAKTARAKLEREVLAPGRTAPTQSFAAEGLSGVFHLGMQFAQRLLVEADGVAAAKAGRNADAGNTQSESAPALGPPVRLMAVRADSLVALPPNPRGGLAMSDLRPMLLPRRLVGELPPSGSPALREATRRLAYPFKKILPGAPLALYFEAYHLRLEPEDDRTRYTVAYEIARRTDAGGLRGLFGGEETERTATASTYRGPAGGGPARELILIDLAEAGVEPGGEVVVTVRVTDEVSGETGERQLAFTVTDPTAAAPENDDGDDE